MEAKLYGQNKGGMSINGIIKDYYVYAEENISAGDLVEYVNGVASKVDYGESVDTAIHHESKTGDVISAVALDDNRVFIAYSYGSDYYLYGVVVTINGSALAIGTRTAINRSYKHSGYAISTCLLPNGDVFIAHSYTSSSVTHGLYCEVITINDTTITTKIAQELINASDNGNVISAISLNNGKVFIARSYTSSYSLAGFIVSITENGIAKGSDTVLVNVAGTGKAISACLLPNGNVFVAHSEDSTGYYLNAIVCSISDITISKGVDTEISTSDRYSGYAISCVALDDNRVFIAHSRDTGRYLSCIVCSINGITITVGTDTAVNKVDDRGRYLSTIVLDSNKVFLTHSSGSSANSHSLSAVICNIDGTNITYGTDTELLAVKNSGAGISTALLNNGNIFIAHKSGNATDYLNAQIWAIDYENNIPTNHIVATDYETQVRKVTTGLFDGVAKTSGMGGDDTEHNEAVSIWTKE